MKLFKKLISQSNKVVIFAENGFGDYLLVRDFFTYLRNSKKYKSYKIIFLAQNDRINLSKRYDQEYIDEWILLDSKSIDNVIQQLNTSHITDLINLTVLNNNEEPEGPLTEILFKKVKAQNKYGHVFGDIKENKNYKPIHTPNKKIFEYERNRIFFSKLINENIDTNSCHTHITPSYSLKGKFIGIAPFAGKLFRFKQWNIANYICLLKRINNTFPDFKIVLIGNNVNKIDIDAIMSGIDFNVINTFNKLDSADLPSFLSCLEYLITPESGLVHLAVAMEQGPRCIVLSNGSFYKRFLPYQTERINYIYPKSIEDNLNKKNLYGFKQNQADINDISIDKVFSFLYKELSKEEYA